jgi:8-oxo-dGTP pyrophosphatase MutT (NUDIX family)
MSPRTKVIISLINSGQVLLAKNFDPTKRRYFYLPIGGGVEFREYLEDAARREVKEEVGLAVDDLEFKGFTENHFEFDGIPEHEIVYHYLTRINDDTRAALPVHGTESNGEAFPIAWYSSSALDDICDSVVPPGLYEQLVAELSADQ